MVTENVTQLFYLTRAYYYGFFYQSTVAFAATHNLTVLSSCNKRPADTDISACKCFILHIERGFTKSKYNVHFQSRKKELAGRLVSLIAVTLKGYVVSVHNFSITP
jgi:hypothetical protein